MTSVGQMAFMVLWTMTKERNKISPIHIQEVLAISRTIMVVNGKFGGFFFQLDMMLYQRSK